MSSKFLGVIIILTFLALSAALFFQISEMQAYELPSTLKERFFPSTPAAAPATAAPTAPAAEMPAAPAQP